jgi:hypothetical protein
VLLGGLAEHEPPPRDELWICVRENVVSQAQQWINWRPSLKMLPQLGMGGGTPRPRKLNPASVRIALAIYNVAMTTSVDTELGKTCRAITRTGELPMARAAMI